MTVTKRVIVTGGTHGLGRTVAMDLARNGHKVVAVGLDSPGYSSVTEGSVSTLRKECEGENIELIVIEADVSNARQVQEVVDTTRDILGGVDVLVNNAAIGPLGTVLDTDEETFERILSVNLKGAFLTMKACIPSMVDNGGGTIVNVGSGAGWGKPNMAVYAASKGGLVALGSSTAYDFFHDKIRVNTVIPGGGGIASGITRDRYGESWQVSTDSAVGSVAGRPVEGKDVSTVVRFLMDDAAESVSGTVIDVGCFANQGGPVPRKES